MWPRIILALGVVIVVLALAIWYLLSGFGCEMNTSGCKTVRLDWSRDALSIFMPMLGVGALLVVLGLRMMR